MRRDTVVVVQRDTVFLQPDPNAERPSRPSSRDEAYYRERYRERQEGQRYETREERMQRLAELRALRDEQLANLPSARPNEHAYAVLVYPTRLLELEFPAVTAGVSYVKDGKLGIMASLGVLTVPLGGRDFDGNPIAEARGPLRGIDIGVEGRLYTSALWRSFPMYLGAGISYSQANVAFNRYVPNASNTFSRSTESDAQGRRIRGSALVGWELRTGGFACDLTTGLEISGRGIFTLTRASFARSIGLSSTSTAPTRTT